MLVGTTLAESDESKFWLGKAESACDEIKRGDPADQAFTRLLQIYAEWGQLEKAGELTKRIRNSSRRLWAHILVARHYAEAGNLELCKLQLELAKPLAVKPRARDELIHAYFEYAKSPSLASSFIKSQYDDSESNKKLCEVLARHGYLDKAFDIAEYEINTERQLNLKLMATIEAAKSARIEDAEQAVRHLAMRGATEYDQQRVWSELSKALYRKDDLESARHYAKRLTDAKIKRSNRYLKRIEDGVPLNALYIRMHSPERSVNSEIPLRTDDPEVANRILEEVIAEAERNPVETTEGQFGPWNQKFQLARIRVQYGLVAALYRKAGDQEQATIKMQIAEEAIKILIEEAQGFGAMFALNELQVPLIYFEDTEGLRRLAESLSVPLLFWAADAVVPDMLMSGDVEAAKKLAKTTLSREPGFDRSTGDQSEMVSCFIEAEKLEAAHEILKSSKPGNFTAAACENAGRAMFQMDRGQQLRTSQWRDDIGAFQRVYLCVGAALMAKETDSER